MVHHHDTLVATIKSPAEGVLAVYVTRHPMLPPMVMWRDGTTYHYLPPDLGRVLGAAFCEAADQAEKEAGP